VPWAKSYRARVKVWTGDISEAAALQDDYLPALREIQDLQLLTAALSISARIELARGDAVAAVGLLDEFFAVTEGKSPMYRALYMTDVVRLLIEIGDVEKAREWAAGSIGPGLRNGISSATTEAMLAEASGDYEGALTGYDAAAAAWADFGFVLEQALALYGAGRSLTALDRSGEAAERLDAARRILSELDATPTIDEIDGVADQAAAL
jgi:tetratricopeptide (TPR) repeat protein